VRAERGAQAVHGPRARTPARRLTLEAAPPIEVSTLR
jgi:hypothetical protein